MKHTSKEEKVRDRIDYLSSELLDCLEREEATEREMGQTAYALMSTICAHSYLDKDHDDNIDKIIEEMRQNIQRERAKMRKKKEAAKR